MPIYADVTTLYISSRFPDVYYPMETAKRSSTNGKKCLVYMSNLEKSTEWVIQLGPSTGQARMLPVLKFDPVKIVENPHWVPLPQERCHLCTKTKSVNGGCNNFKIRWKPTDIGSFKSWVCFLNCVQRIAHFICCRRFPASEHEGCELLRLDRINHFLLLFEKSFAIGIREQRNLVRCLTIRGNIVIVHLNTCEGLWQKD